MTQTDRYTMLKRQAILSELNPWFTVCDPKSRMFLWISGNIL